MSTAPSQRSRQLTLRFDDTPVWDPTGLEAALQRAASRPVRLVLTENRSVLLSFRRRGGATWLRLHRMFLHAPPPVVRAVARGLRRRTSRSADGDVRRFMNENLHRVRRVPRTLPPLVTRGQVHDLQHVYERLNARFFASALRVPLTWGRGSGRARRRGAADGRRPARPAPPPRAPPLPPAAPAAPDRGSALPPGHHRALRGLALGPALRGGRHGGLRHARQALRLLRAHRGPGPR